MGPRVLVVQTVDIGHEEEEVGVNHGCRDGGEGVVVTKLDFGHGQRVVLVDDGDDAHVQELVDGPLRIEIAWPLWLSVSDRRQTGHAQLLTLAISFLVRRIWAMGCLRWVNRLSQRLISRHWPIAASAYHSSE